jgi:Uma2 family endonuclease
MATATSPTAETTLVSPEPTLEHYEVIDGRIVETPPMDAFETWLASDLSREMGTFAKANGLGWVVVEMLFLIDHARNLQRRPDLAFVSAQRWPLNQRVPSAPTWDVVPDLAVEVISPTNSATDVMKKIEDYFRTGTRLVWVIYPDQRKIYVYESPTIVRILQIGDDLDGGAVLPGFRMPLASLFGEGKPARA